MDAILKILEEDALTSPEMIAQRLNKTAAEVRHSIKQMEEDKIILGYKAIVDDDKALRTVVRAMIEVKITPEREGGFNRVAERIAKFQEVKSCYLMSGSYDLLVEVEGPDLRHAAGFVSQKLSTIQGVLSTATHFVLKPYKEQGTLYVQETLEDRLKVSP